MSFDDSKDDSLLEIPVFMRINSRINEKKKLEKNEVLNDSFESVVNISESIISTDKSNSTLILDSDSDEEKHTIVANDVSNDSIAVVFCSPELERERSDSTLTSDHQFVDNLREDKSNDGNTSVISFASIGSIDWTPIKPNFINRTPNISKSGRNRSQTSIKKSINILNNKNKTNERKGIGKEDKIKQKNEKLIQKEMQKLKENAHKEVLRSRGLKNAKKYCFASIDYNLYESVKQYLDPLFSQNECNLRLNNNPLIPMSVTWIRKSLHLVEGQDSQTIESSQMSSQTTIGDTEVQQKYILIVIDANDFIERVDSYVRKSGETLLDFAKEIIQKTGLKNITLLVLKLEQYFKKQKTKAQNQFRQRLNEIDCHSTQSRRQNRRESLPSVTREDVDLALIDLEIKLMSFDSNSKISVIKANDYSEVSLYMYRYTRSVAESLMRNERKNQIIGWFAEADNRSTVDPTDASTHKKLWRRQLMQFPKISYEVSEAIVGQYPTPKSLLEAYSYDSNPENLLSDIIVSRRQPNGANTERKVGPQLSTRIHLFMTSREGNQLLNN